MQLTSQEGIAAAIEEGTGQYLVLPLRSPAQITGKQSLDSPSQTPREAQPKQQQQQWPHPRPKVLSRFPYTNTKIVHPAPISCKFSSARKVWQKDSFLV